MPLKKRVFSATAGALAWAAGAVTVTTRSMRMRCGWLRMLRAMGDLVLRFRPSIRDGQDDHKRQFSSGRVRDRRRTDALCERLHEVEGGATLSAREVLRELGIDADRPTQLTADYARRAFGSHAEGATEVIVQYSGGSDSTCAAVLATLVFDRVHLLTFENPFISSSARSVVNAQKLIAMFPEREILHERIDAGDALETLLFGSYLRDLRRYGTASAGWPCLACKVSFDVETVRYAHRHHTALVADGSDLRVEYQLSQGNRATLGLREEWFGSHGVSFVHPVAEIEDTVLELLLFGAGDDRGVLIYPQQGCCVGNDMAGTAYKRFYYIPRYGMESLRSRAEDWMRDKRPVCDSLVRDCRHAGETCGAYSECAACSNPMLQQGASRDSVTR